MESYEAYHNITHDSPRHKFLLAVPSKESPLKLLLTIDQMRVIKFLIDTKVLDAILEVAPEDEWEEP